MKVLATLILLLSFIGPITAQTQPRTRGVKPPEQNQKLKTQTAITKEGRTVLLKSDGTWEYTADPPLDRSVETSASTRGGGNVAIEAALVYRSGDVRPVARASVFLLDADLARILRGAGLKPIGTGSLAADTDDNLLYTYGAAIKFASLNQYGEFYTKAVEVVRGHIMHETTTDFTGRASFENVQPGSYFVCSFAETARGFVVWNVAVEVRGNQVTKAVLDQNTAAYAS